MRYIKLQIDHDYCISSNLTGGLGNNLFQIAAVLSFAYDRKCKPIIESIRVPGHTINKNDEIPDNICDMFPKLPCVKGSQYVWDNYVKSFDSKTGEIVQLNNIIKNKKKVKLIGVFASYLYFHKNEEYIKNMLTVSPIIDNYVKKKYKNIINNDSTISLHIRRGDYLQRIEKNDPVYCLLGMDYYEKAIDRFDDKYLFILFCEKVDTEWMQNNIIKYLDKNKKKYILIQDEKAIVDLHLISLCKNNIIANSTFSFWGAYLNNNKNKIIIAPSAWNHHNRPDISSVERKYRHPKSWTILDCQCHSK
jgi:hypothetical protein